jgi:hypothetical protein
MAGRGYFQVGEQGMFKQFQTAYVGAEYELKDSRAETEQKEELFLELLADGQTIDLMPPSSNGKHLEPGSTELAGGAIEIREPFTVAKAICATLVDYAKAVSPGCRAAAAAGGSLLGSLDQYAPAAGTERMASAGKRQSDNPDRQRAGGPLDITIAHASTVVNLNASRSGRAQRPQPARWSCDYSGQPRHRQIDVHAHAGDQSGAAAFAR